MREILRAGQVDVLVGQPESSWLEVKSSPWQLGTLAGRIELGQDVGRHANADGGLIIVGAKTRKSDGVESIVRVRGVDPAVISISQVRATIDSRVFPMIDGLDVYLTAAVEGRRPCLVIEIPPQPDNAKPFLVQGAFVGTRAEGAFISVVRRRGEESIPVTASELHAWLAIGRQVYRTLKVDTLGVITSGADTAVWNEPGGSADT